MAILLPNHISHLRQQVCLKDAIIVFSLPRSLLVKHPAAEEAIPLQAE